MPANRVSIELDDAAVRAAVTRLIEAVRDPRDAFDEIGSRLAASTIGRFDRETDPDGRPWLKSLRVLAGGGQTLTLDGGLRRSITHDADRDGVDVGSNLPYAAIHQLGGRAGRGRAARIPARPFLGVSSGDGEAILRIISHHVGEALR